MQYCNKREHSAVPLCIQGTVQEELQKVIFCLRNNNSRLPHQEPAVIC